MQEGDLYEDMPISSILNQCLKEQEWDDTIEVNDDRTIAQVRTELIINDQPHYMFFEAEELKHRFAVYLHGPYKVSPSRVGEICRLLNLINLRLSLGRFACLEDSDSYPIHFRARIDVEGGTLQTKQVEKLVTAAYRAFDYYGPIIVTVAITEKSASLCWAELLAQEQNRKRTE